MDDEMVLDHPLEGRVPVFANCPAQVDHAKPPTSLSANTTAAAERCFPYLFNRLGCVL